MLSKGRGDRWGLPDQLTKIPKMQSCEETRDKETKQTPPPPSQVSEVGSCYNSCCDQHNYQTLKRKETIKDVIANPCSMLISIEAGEGFKSPGQLSIKDQPSKPSGAARSGPLWLPRAFRCPHLIKLYRFTHSPPSVRFTLLLHGTWLSRFHMLGG